MGANFCFAPDIFYLKEAYILPAAGLCAWRIAAILQEAGRRAAQVKNLAAPRKVFLWRENYLLVDLYSGSQVVWKLLKGSFQYFNMLFFAVFVFKVMGIVQK
jgi:hypothetical protein